MAKQLDKILVIDIESTCWESSPPKGETSDIIEIGLCVFDINTRQKEEKVGWIIRPQRSKVSPFCTELTSLTQQQVEQGISFEAACRELKKEYSSEDRVWASYGDYDRRQFERQCKDLRIGYPFGPTHLNVKTLFAIHHKLPREMGMAQALEHLDLPLEGTHHRGIDDAWNIAEILRSFLN